MVRITIYAQGLYHRDGERLVDEITTDMCCFDSIFINSTLIFTIKDLQLNVHGNLGVN